MDGVNLCQAGHLPRYCNLETLYSICIETVAIQGYVTG